mmetsp:Transcript_67848/g.167580  ORF Transcript_67848/g.167580 Transcript_67848/m.167580 type:complete len:274 (+) Transcript_67848:296-1117(+)
MAPRFLRGLRFWADLEKPGRAARTLLCTSSELMMRARSGLNMVERGRVKNFFTSLLFVYDPKMLSSFSKAACDQMMNLPRWPPGASLRRLSLSTFMTSTPGMLRNDCSIPLLPLYTTRGPLRCTYLLFLILPLPLRIFFESLTCSTSSKALCALRHSMASLVLVMASISLEITRGTSPTLLILWPRAMRRAGTAEAARAEQTATRRSLLFVLAVHFLHVLLGANMRPPRHMLPKAPWPERCVPPPAIRGIRDTARPVPHEMADCCMPAFMLTP